MGSWGAHVLYNESSAGVRAHLGLDIRLRNDHSNRRIVHSHAHALAELTPLFSPLYEKSGVRTYTRRCATEEINGKLFHVGTRFLHILIHRYLHFDALHSSIILHHLLIAFLIDKVSHCRQEQLRIAVFQ